MFRLGLTGSIATGKSTVLRFFAELDLPVYSADAAVHELYAGPAVPAVEALFPGVTANGTVDRAKLAARLVESPGELPRLEAVVHPLVRDKMADFLGKAGAAGADLAVLEIPLLFETRHEYPLDAVAVTVCSDEVQRRRALARPGMSVEKLETVLARQVPQAEKMQKADFVIRTDVSLDRTRAEVARIAALCRQIPANRHERDQPENGEDRI